MPVPTGATVQIMPGPLGGLYRNTTQALADLNATNTQFGNPTWTDQLVVKDVKPVYPWDKAEALSRETPLKLYAKTQMDLSFQVVVRADLGNADYIAWVNKAFSRQGTFDLLVLNHKITTPGALGVRGEFLVSMPEEPQEIGGTLYATFDLIPTRTVNALPKFAMVTSVAVGPPAVPTLTFTDITYTT